MAAVYGSATIAAVPSKANTVAAQDMIGNNQLPAVTQSMRNGHVGGGQNQVVTPVSAAMNIAAQDTPGIKNDASAIKWDIPTGTWVAGP